MTRQPNDPLTNPQPGDKLQGPVIGLHVDTLTQEQSTEGLRVTQVRCSLYTVKDGEYFGNRTFTLPQFVAFASGPTVEVVNVAQ